MDTMENDEKIVLANDNTWICPNCNEFNQETLYSLQYDSVICRNCGNNFDYED